MQLYRDETWLKNEYTDNERSITSLSREMQCSSSTIHHWLIYFDIESRATGEFSTYPFYPLINLYNLS